MFQMRVLEEKLAFDDMRKVKRILEFYVKLKSSTTDYYELAGLSSSATASEIKQAHDDFSQYFLSDLFATKSNPEFVEIANYVFDEMNTIFEILITEAYRRESA